MCPSVFLGPIIIKKNSPSIDFFKKFFNGDPLPKLSFGFLDVRDVALGHVLALEKPEVSRGRRYILSNESYFFTEIS